MIDIADTQDATLLKRLDKFLSKHKGICAVSIEKNTVQYTVMNNARAEALATADSLTEALDKFLTNVGF